jgi:hypothetical protein
MSNGDGGLLWAQLGINLHDMLAGFAGGTVYAIALKKSDPWSIFTSVAAGGLTANYMTDPMGHYLGTSPGPSGFIAGLTAMAIAQGLISAARAWKPAGFGPTGGGGGIGGPPEGDGKTSGSTGGRSPKGSGGSGGGTGSSGWPLGGE